jgi:hypothetical protein
MSIISQKDTKKWWFESFLTDILVNFNNNLSMEIVQSRGVIISRN